MIKLTLILIMLLPFSTQAADELKAPEWNLGVGVGPNFTQLDAVNDDLESSFGAALWLSREWGERNRLDISINYFDFDGTRTNYPALSAGYGFRFFTDSKLKPFVLAGAGFGSANSFPRADDSSQLAPHFFARAGVKELFAGEKWSIGLIYDFFYVKLDGHDATSAQLGLPMLTFNWRFDNTPTVPQREDTDQDGVFDDKDECPNTPRGTKVNSIGCQPKQKVTKSLKVEFDTDKTIVKERYFPVVEAFGKFMKDNPDIEVVIEGHTDSVGGHDHNMTLSAGRAAAVRDAIIQRTGVDPKRLKSEGYGPDKPIVSNESVGGRQKNRRVVAVVSSK